MLPVMLTRRALFASASTLLSAMAQSGAGAPETAFSPLRDWTIVDGPESAFEISGDEVAVSPFASFPTWLRSAREYENFELRGEFLLKGWTDSGLYLHAPWHGRPTWAGLQLKIFHQKDETPTAQSAGAILPVIAPRAVPVQDGWNRLRVWMDWPRLRVWINDKLVQDIDRAAEPALAGRLRQGYLGIAAASAPCRFRNLRIRELPPQLRWKVLFAAPADLDQHWQVSEGKPEFVTVGGVLRSEGYGYLATRERFQDFELEMYVRAASQHNAGVLFRSSGRGRPDARHYEIQLHNVEEARYPTGSLYGIRRAVYPRIEDGRWFLFQLRVAGAGCRVRVNGDTVMEFSGLDLLDAGHIELQAHRRGYWTEYARIRVQEL